LKEVLKKKISDFTAQYWFTGKYSDPIVLYINMDEKLNILGYMIEPTLFISPYIILCKGYHGPDDMYGPEGMVKQLSKALIEKAMQASNLRFALTEQLGYEKNGTGDKPTQNRRNGKSSKTLRTNQSAMEIEIPRDREGGVRAENRTKTPEGMERF
jgi:hypothetical protein